MSILRKRGKEKLRFKIMNNRVPNPIFKNLKGLITKSLNENAGIAEKLDKYYKLIQVCFFYEAKDPNVENTIREILRNPSLTHSLKSDPAFAQSYNSLVMGDWG